PANGSLGAGPRFHWGFSLNAPPSQKFRDRLPPGSAPTDANPAVHCSSEYGPLTTGVRRLPAFRPAALPVSAGQEFPSEPQRACWPRNGRVPRVRPTRERHRVLAHADQVANDLRSMRAGTGPLAAEWRPRRAGSLARKVSRTGPQTERRAWSAPG